MARDRNLPNKGDVQTFNGSEWVPLSFMQAAVVAGFLLLVDAITYFVDDLDGTKRVRFQLSGLTTGTDRQWTFPDRDDTFAGLLAQTFTGIQTFTNNIAQTGATTLSTGTGAGTYSHATETHAGTVQFDSRVALGAPSGGAVAFRVSTGFAGTSTVSQIGIESDLTGSSAATSAIYGLVGSPTTAASAFTCAQVVDVSSQPRAKGAGSTVTRRASFASFTSTDGGTANYGWYHGSSITLAGTGNFAFYNDTASPNYFGTGATLINATAAIGAEKLFVNGQSYLGPSSGTFAGNIIQGVQDATAAIARQVGEVLSSTVTAAAVAATGTVGNITSLSLTAGDWLISGYCVINAGATGLTTGSAQKMSIVTTTATNGTNGSTMVQASVQALVANGLHHVGIPQIRINISATTTYFLTEEITYGGGTPTAAGTIIATRIR